MPPPDQDLLSLATAFDLRDEPISVAPWGNGHIHDSYVSQLRGGQRFLHQRINRNIFPSPDRLMENIERVTGHLRRKIKSAGEDPERRCLTLVPTREGKSFLRTPDGHCWRTYRFVEGTVAPRPGDGSAIAAAARSFAAFQRMLCDLPGPPLHETIPHFGDTRRRFELFRRTLEEDPRNRADEARAEIRFVQGRELLASRPGDDDLPERVIHYDTKLDNVLLDQTTGEGICVIDLDTVMTGTTLYDFGDLARLGASTAPEDEPDPGRVAVDLDLFEHLARGYLEEAGDFLTNAEIDLLTPAVGWITFTMGVRFLTDYLAGDPYFKTARPEHNLDRCRTHLALVRDLERKQENMRRIIERCR
jgi:Ser/Thr protein kinase RdoA (MazF antagonist)